MAATLVGGAGANSDPNSGSVSGPFFQVGRDGEEVVAGRRLGGGGTAVTPRPPRGFSLRAWMTGSGSAGSGDGAPATADAMLVTTRIMDG